MPTVNAATTPIPAHNKPSGYNDGEGRTTARDELSVVLSSERPQPGAFPIAGRDQRRRRNASCRDDDESDDGPVRPHSSDEEEELEWGDREPTVHPRRTLVRNDSAIGATVFVPEAYLVTSSGGDDLPLVEGQKVVEMSATKRKRLQRRRFVCLLVVMLGVAGIASGVAVGLTLKRNSDRLPPLPEESLPNFRQLFESLPSHTLLSLEIGDSPQHQAWNWLTTTEFYSNADFWNLRQRFALVCLRFATNAFASGNGTPFSPVPLDIDECSWNGVSCNEGGNVTGLALENRNLTGSLPRELYFLYDLSILTLSLNAITGSLSSDIQLLSNLEVFDLSNIGFTGTLPSELIQRTQLEHLDFGSSLS